MYVWPVPPGSVWPGEGRQDVQQGAGGGVCGAVDVRVDVAIALEEKVVFGVVQQIVVASWTLNQLRIYPYGMDSPCLVNGLVQHGF